MEQTNLFQFINDNYYFNKKIRIIEFFAGYGDGIYINRPHQKRGVVQKGMIQTIKTSGNDIGVVVSPNVKNVHSENGVVLLNTLRIRRFTPRECFRLMGVRDEDFDKLKDFSNSSLYHLAGDSIVVNVLMAIFKEMK